MLVPRRLAVGYCPAVLSGRAGPEKVPRATPRTPYTLGSARMPRTGCTHGGRCMPVAHATICPTALVADLLASCARAPCGLQRCKLPSISMGATRNTASRAGHYCQGVQASWWAAKAPSSCIPRLHMGLVHHLPACWRDVVRGQRVRSHGVRMCNVGGDTPFGLPTLQCVRGRHGRQCAPGVGTCASGCRVGACMVWPMCGVSRQSHVVQPRAVSRLMAWGESRGQNSTNNLVSPF